MNEEITPILHSFLPPDLSGLRLNFELLYRGSRDGISAQAFHKKCDDKSNTVSIISDSRGNMFGGFADIAWNSSSVVASVKSEKSFLFSLKSSVGNGTVKFPVNSKNALSTFHDPTYFYSFGKDLHITAGNAQVNIGVSYINPPGMNPHYCAGIINVFTVQEVEVYQVVREACKVEVSNYSEDSITIGPKSEPLHSWIVDALVRGGSFCKSFDSELLYRGITGGFKPADFHTRCDSIPNTVYVTEDDEGHIIGGYADTPWTSSLTEVTVESANSFVFDIGLSGTPKLNKKSNILTHNSMMLCVFHGLSLASDGALIHNITERRSSSSSGSGSVTSSLHRIKKAVKINVSKISTSIIAPGDQVDEAVSASKIISTIYTSQTEDIASQLLDEAKLAQRAEEDLLLELMWIEHLCVPASERNLASGLLADWQTTVEASADVRPLSNGVDIKSCRSETLKRIEESMSRLQMKNNCEVGNQRREMSHEESKTSMATTTVDEVISFNVGGTIIAVLCSTLCLQAPESTFATNCSGRWTQQPDELDEHGNICMLDEDPRCFRRIISYLQLKSL